MTKRKSEQNEQGSVLIMALLTILILTMICVTSLQVTTQTATATVQTTSWQQAMAGAEAAVDRAMAALNQDAQGATSAWSGWYTINPSDGSLPSVKPDLGTTGPPSATSKPSDGQYNYYTSTFALQGEASNAVRMWVTVDNGSVAPASSSPLIGKHGQAYRIRAAAAVDAPGPARVSNNKLDNDLRKISLRYDRFAQTAVNIPQALRRVEVIAVPVGSPSNGVRGIIAVNWISLSGAMEIDSFDSSDPFKSSTINGSPGQYDVNKRQSHGDVATTNSTGSDFRNTYVYGSVAYSGPPIRNTTNVQGTISTPFNADIPPVMQPDWSSMTYTSYGGGGSNPPNGGLFTAGPSGNPVRIKVNGDLKVSNGALPLRIVRNTPTSSGSEIVIWVTGQLVTSGSGFISQEANVKVTWYVGNKITVSGSSYQNLGGYASNLTIYGYGALNTAATVSGSGNFIGCMDVPNYATTISGGGDWVGALITNKLTMSGGSNFHYDEALDNGGGGAVAGSYAYASWFEDNSNCWVDSSGQTRCRNRF